MTWERALEADARLAAKNAVLIRAALRQQFDAERAYQGYLNTTPNLELNIVQQRARARAWAVMNLRINLEPLKEVIYRTWAQAYVLGDTAAREAIQEAELARKADTRGVVDWSKWKPGDAAAAVILKPPRAFQRLLEKQGITWKGFSDTTLTDIGNAIGEAITLGLDAKASAKLIQNHAASPARALSIAITEQNRAISAATVERYQQAGLQQMEWLVFQPCDKCAQNAGKVVNIGGQFPSGDTQPPAHPHCRCALAPVIPGFDEQQAVPGATVITPPPAPAPVEVAAEIVEAVTPVAVSSVFVPGQWTKLSRVEIENRLIDSYMAANPRYSRSEIIDFFQQGRVKKADLAMIKSGRVLKNGPIEVEFYSAGAKVTPAAEKKLLESIEELQKYMPKDKMTFIVASERGNAYGSAILGDAKIWLKPSTVMDSKPLKSEVGFKMPSISAVPHRDYTLAHEWGHTVDIGGTFTRKESIQNSLTTMKIERLRKEFKDNPLAFVSGYSNKNTKEFYAEMFAEFFLTKGQTNNPLVLAMAKEFNWKTATPVVKPPALLTSNKTSAERNLEINQQIDELKTMLGKDISDERLLYAVKASGTQGEIDNTTIYWPLKKKFEQAGLSPDDAKLQTQGYLMRLEYYLENKEGLPRVFKAIEEMDPAEAARYNARAEVVKKRLFSAMQNGKVTIGVNRVAFKAIFEDGRFKSQFESKTSGGLLDPYIRKTREKTTFDIDVNTPNKERPIYGYITDNQKATVPGMGETINDALNNVLSVWNENAMQYGNYKIILKDSVKNRATVTIGDSLRKGVLGENLTEPKPDFVNMGFYTWGAPPRRVGLPDFSYFETQIHGGVTIDDIDSIILPMKPDDLGFKEVQEIIQKSGRDIKVIAGGAGE